MVTGASDPSADPSWPLWLMAASLALGVVALALLAWPKPAAEPLPAAFAQEGLHLDLPAGFQLIQDVATREGRHRSLEAQRGADRLVLKVERGLDTERAKDRLTEQVELIESLFAERQAPYPGQLSTSLSCPQEYLPRQQAPGPGQDALLLRLYANDRLTFGGCSQDLLSYQAAVALLHCPQTGSLVQLELFSPMEQPDEGLLAAAGSLACAGPR